MVVRDLNLARGTALGGSLNETHGTVALGVLLHRLHPIGR